MAEVDRREPDRDEQRRAELGYKQELTMVGGLFLIVGAWWLLGAKDRYHGPVRTVHFGEAAGVIEDEPEAEAPARA